MDKKDIVSELSMRTGHSKRESEVIIDTVFDIIADALELGRKVKLVDFGIFEVKERAPRTGRNPKANLPVHIPAKRVPYFTPGKVLKSRVEKSNK